MKMETELLFFSSSDSSFYKNKLSNYTKLMKKEPLLLKTYEKDGVFFLLFFLYQRTSYLANLKISLI